MERKIWVPCAGLNFTNPPRLPNHIGEIRLEVSPLENLEATGEWITEQEAQKLYPDAIISTSHGRCPDCSAVWRAAAAQVIESNTDS